MPGQIEKLPYTFIVGDGKTLTVLLATLEHPFNVPPVTEYVIVLMGEIAIEEDVPPVLQVYVLAPPAVKVTAPPLQSVELPAIVITREGVTVMFIVLLFAQRLVVLVPETTYEVDVMGDTTMLELALVLFQE